MINKIEHKETTRETPGLYSVKDIVSDTFSPPFVASNTPDAIRKISHMLKTAPEDSIHRMHPQDFHLYRLCGWNDHTAIPGYDCVRVVMFSSLLPSKVKVDSDKDDGKFIL